MVVCAAGKCSNSSRIKQMRFFKFPSEEARRKVWKEKAELQEEPGPYAKLCERNENIKVLGCERGRCAVILNDYVSNIMVGCVAPNCKNSTRNHVRLFRFPRDDSRRKIWVTNCQLGVPDTAPYTRLCEIHFEESQFELHRQDGWRKLKPNAIPTVFPDPVEKEKKKRKRQVTPDPEEEPKDKKRQRREDSPKKNSGGQTQQKENVQPRRRKGRPRKKCPDPVYDLDSDTEIESEKEDEKNEHEKQFAVLKRENETMRQEIQEFEKHNKAMSRVIMELEKHNKAMSIKLQELDKDNRVMTKKLQDLEKQNEDLKAKLNCCFSEEQYARMEKLMALGKIERYIPGVK